MSLPLTFSYMPSVVTLDYNLPCDGSPKTVLSLPLKFAQSDDLRKDPVASAEMGSNQFCVVCPNPPTRLFAKAQLDPKQLIPDSGICTERNHKVVKASNFGRTRNDKISTNVLEQGQ